MLVLSSCWVQSEPVLETAAFDRAETSFRKGIYERALEDYQAFIKANPESPLANTARLRIRTIKREVSSMLENPKLEGAVYHGRARAEEARALELLNSLETESATESNKRE